MLVKQMRRRHGRGSQLRKRPINPHNTNEISFFGDVTFMDNEVAVVLQIRDTMGAYGTSYDLLLLTQNGTGWLYGSYVEQVGS